jgi:hypothetical protein
LAEIESRTGSDNVVVLPLVHLTVPPFSRSEAAILMEPPPVSPPVQPLMVMPDAALPVMVVQVIVTAFLAHAGLVRPAVIPKTGTMAAATSKTLRMLFPLSVMGTDP